MGLASALSTALTGLTAAETTIDVVGNNLANSNTVGFKSSTAYFATQFLQTQSLGSQPTPGNGGTNPRQLGLGAMVAQITPNFNQGTIEISANPTDLAIQDDGFFMVQGQTGGTFYTRNGVFSLNSQNELTALDGSRLLGYGVDEEFQIDTTQLVPITIPLGVEVVAQATNYAYLEGNLSADGDMATTAQRIQTGILGDARHTGPTSETSVAQAIEPALAANPTQVVAGGSLTEGATYEYRIVFATDDYNVTSNPPDPVSEFSEGLPSETISQAIPVGANRSVEIDLPSDATGNYQYVRVYRREQGGPAEFTFVGDTPLGTATFTDDGSVPLGPTLNENTLSGNYTYYVTFEKNGVESRPSPISDPIPVAGGRVILNDLPIGDPAEWDNIRIYRNLASDDTSFHLVGQVSGVDDATRVLVDDFSDAEISGNPTLDLDGPRIIPSTLLVNVLQRNGSNYEHLFKVGTLDFTATKGGRTLETQQFTITANSTVQDLINFMRDSMGIQPTTADSVHPIPTSTPPDPPAVPGGTVTADGRIVITGNNGVDNAVDISTSGFLLTTAAGVENIDMPWQVSQEAVGESAVADFVAYDSLGIPVQVRLTAVLESKDSTSTTYRWFADSRDNDPDTGSAIAVGTGLITFDGEGNFVNATETTVSIERRNIASVSPLEFDLDFSRISGLAPENTTAAGGNSNLAVSRQDGSSPGTLASYIVGQDGTIQGVFTNGVTRELGQISLARFANPAGLEQRGQNMFAAGINSGLAVVGNPGEQGLGTLISGAVELSNTDIGENLIDLILASTMYRGNTRVITTVQQMVDELLAIRR